MSFGRPMDCFGNFVNAEGESFDTRDHIIDIRDYFMMDGNLSTNYQRESEYTKNLGIKIAQRYKAENIILSSHLVSYVAFQLLKEVNTSLDLFGLLSLPEDEYFFSRAQFVEQSRVVIEFFKTKAVAGLLKLPEIFEKGTLEVVLNGINQIGTFHSNRPIAIHKNGDFYSQDFRLLYFYNNRLESYDFEKEINWNNLPVVYQVD